MVAITTLTVTANRAYRIADRFRKKGVKVILGGPHASAMPEEAKSHADAVAIGNAETTLPDIINDLEKGALRSIFKRSQFGMKYCYLGKYLAANLLRNIGLKFQ